MNNFNIKLLNINNFVNNPFILLSVLNKGENLMILFIYPPLSFLQGDSLIPLTGLNIDYRLTPAAHRTIPSPPPPPTSDLPLSSSSEQIKNNLFKIHMT